MSKQKWQYIVRMLEAGSTQLVEQRLLAPYL
jgi:hypothetical protein